jgi:hypothetical protein
MKKPAPTVSQTPIPANLTGQTVSIPRYGQRIPAGFPSPATDYVKGRVNLDKAFVDCNNFYASCERVTKF